MNYAEMSDAEINRNVADIVYLGDQNITPYTHRPDVQVFHKNGCSTMKNYCNSWADAGPIILENRIGLAPSVDVWHAYSDEQDFLCSIANPLRAAMIVFLMIQEKKGDA